MLRGGVLEILIRGSILFLYLGITGVIIRVIISAITLCRGLSVVFGWFFFLLVFFYFLLDLFYFLLDFYYLLLDNCHNFLIITIALRASFLLLTSHI